MADKQIEGIYNIKLYKGKMTIDGEKYKNALREEW